jgi:hypothetical protein
MSARTWPGRGGIWSASQQRPGGSKTDLPDGCRSKKPSSPLAKIFCFSVAVYCAASRVEQRDVRVVTNAERNAVDAGVLIDVAAHCERRSRVVLARPCRRLVSRTLQRLSRSDGSNSRLTGEHNISRKPLRRESRCDTACTCGLAPFAQLKLARRPRVQRSPGLPCTLCASKRVILSKARAQRAARSRTPIRGLLAM